MEKSVERSPVVNKINSILSPISDELKVTSYEISDNEQLAKFKNDHPAFKLNPEIQFRYAEVGVWASNYDAWVNFLKTDKEYLLMFEDDVYVSENFPDRIDKVLQEIPEDWDAFFFLTPYGNKTYYKSEEHDIGLENICRMYQGNWLGCYMLSRKGVEALVNGVQEYFISDPVDIYLFYKQSFLKAYNFKPFVEDVGGDLALGTTIHNVKRIGE
jgi:GR25 family glycosyltransferase involved in LPS biosynthesis